MIDIDVIFCNIGYQKCLSYHFGNSHQGDGGLV